MSPRSFPEGQAPLGGHFLKGGLSCTWSAPVQRGNCATFAWNILISWFRPLRFLFVLHLSSLLSVSAFNRCSSYHTTEVQYLKHRMTVLNKRSKDIELLKFFF